MDLIVTIPESPEIPAADVVAGAATRLGWTSDHPTTEAEYLAEWAAEQVWINYNSYRTDQVRRQVRDQLPRPERRQPFERAVGGPVMDGLEGGPR